MTDQQKQLFERDGFLIVPNLLAPDLVERLLSASDELHASDSTQGIYSQSGRWERRNCLPDHRIFLELLGHPDVLQLAVGVRGWNIKLLTSHLVKVAPSKQVDQMVIHWHQDGGTISAELPDPLPPLFVKVAFCLSGLSEPSSGGLKVVPGSQRQIGRPSRAAELADPYGAIEVSPQSGDVIIFDWRLWHAVSPNQSNVIRRNLYYGFGPRWMMPMDHVTMPAELISQANPVCRQLLGQIETSMGCYLPKKEDVPLRQWWQEQI